MEDRRGRGRLAAEGRFAVGDIDGFASLFALGGGCGARREGTGDATERLAKFKLPKSIDYIDEMPGKPRFRG